MTSRKQQVLNLIKISDSLVDATYISEQLGIDRSNVSRYLTELYKDGVVNRTDGRPVLYSVDKKQVTQEDLVTFDSLVGKNESLVVSIKQGKAAMLYPPNGLHALIFGESGTGKSMFAECMYEFGLSSDSLTPDAPFVSFNCADYAQNPQLLFGHIFGVKQGAFTGADEDKLGLIAKADGGVLFLDEIHRLPPEGQEMLFTFIDKGTYRPLGENKDTYQATVQIIGATTEKEELFLDTFKRRIPMFITLPSLQERTLEERYDIISLFLSQEANRLSTPIHIEREAILAFILYKTTGNIGQMKRDLKSVCAKSFLHYRTTDAKHLSIGVSDLPLTIQKGLLHIKELPEKFNATMEHFDEEVIYYPGQATVVWRQDVTKDMDVYNTIDDEVTSQNLDGNQPIDLEHLIKKNLNQYFDVYVDELSRNDIHQNLVQAECWEIAEEVYLIAEEKLGRIFNDKAKFTFALHLQSTVERINKNQTINHPNLNEIRKKYLREFQLAIELSSMIEKKFDIDIPFDEIGFMTMFLTTNLSENSVIHQDKVNILLLMHGKSTATSMLEAVQELLGVSDGVAFNMPLSMEPTQIYEQIKQYVQEKKNSLSKGLLILTDMGSLERIGVMLTRETNIQIKTVSFTSTMVVLEAVRMASNGKGLNDIYKSLKISFETIIQRQFEEVIDASISGTYNDVIVVACFTGEGVANVLNDKLQGMLQDKSIKIIQLQFFNKRNFLTSLAGLSKENNILAVVGTVKVMYNNIPFFSAYDILNDNHIDSFRRIVAKENHVASSIEKELKYISNIAELQQEVTVLIQSIIDVLGIRISFEVKQGILLHIIFLVNHLLQSKVDLSIREVTKEQSCPKDDDIIMVYNELKVLEDKYEICFSNKDDRVKYFV
ncbi:sigma-54-dependent transcriptional regulator [Vagococcus jeotgali]|uniref:sigma-54-dependent transcriptional regulator n=1 Tax=Vagococcus jeotgali TaxID=3109030 RepID=UPI002DD93EF3|nr:sigma 54-interacting transcriptional regulator [Vagococcus sp. B2T-5]